MDRLADWLGMDTQTLSWIITGIFSFLFALGATWIKGLRDDIKTERESHAVEIDKVRSDIRIKESAQEQNAEQFRALFKLISEQIAVGNKMAENIQADADRRYTQEQQRQSLIKEFTNEQSKTVESVELLGSQLGKVNDTVKETASDAKAARALTIEVDKSVEGLSEEIQKLTTSINHLKTEVNTSVGALKREVSESLDKVLQQPITENIRNALMETERNILQRIDMLKTDVFKPIVETKTDETNQVISEPAAAVGSLE